MLRWLWENLSALVLALVLALVVWVSATIPPTRSTCAPSPPHSPSSTPACRPGWSSRDRRAGSGLHDAKPHSLRGDGLRPEDAAIPDARGARHLLPGSVAPCVHGDLIDPLTEARVRGNPDLVSSDLTNLDLRGEWFFGSGDNLTVSLFYKDITNPIETVEAPGSDDNIGLTFINAASADVYGVEVEWLKGLGFLPLGNWSDAFFVSGNVTISDSNLKIGGNALNLTNNQRRLTQHAPWVVNLQLGVDAPNERHNSDLIDPNSGRSRASAPTS